MEGVNSKKTSKDLTIMLPMLAGKKVQLIWDNEQGELSEKIRHWQKGELEVSMPTGGSFVIKQKLQGVAGIK